MSAVDLKLGKRIKALRVGLGFSQQWLAEQLGVARPTVSQIENDERKLSVDDLVKLSRLFQVSVEGLLDLEKEPKVVLTEGAKVSEPKPQMRINVPQKNLTKFKEVLLYILNAVGSKPNIGETVIYKLLYFIDFNFYEKYEEQLIGATYIKNRFGPTPVEFKKIVDQMLDKDIVKVKDNYFTFPRTKYLSRRKPDLTKLKANEMEVIDDVLKKLSDMNAKQISDYSHGDVPWVTTEDGKKIEYEAVFYRTPTYSVRDYGEAL